MSVAFVNKVATSCCESQLHSGSMIDPSTLVDPGEVADIIGLGNVRGVAVYRKRYDDFPVPAIEKGRCLLWRRSDVEQWAKATGRIK